jgi:hypothetical protein
MDEITSTLCNLSSTGNDDKEVIMDAVMQNGRALKYASVSLKNDKEVVMTAVSQHGTAL